MERYQYQQEQAFYRHYARELRDRFQRGILYERLPYPQFVTWRYAEINGQLKRPPFQPRTSRPADPTNPGHGTDYLTALRALATGRYNGMGFLLTERDPFTTIDVDSTVGYNRTVYYPGRSIISHFNSYTEYSPSSTGSHILV